MSVLYVGVLDPLVPFLRNLELNNLLLTCKELYYQYNSGALWNRRCPKIVRYHYKEYCLFVDYVNYENEHTQIKKMFSLMKHIQSEELLRIIFYCCSCLKPTYLQHVLLKLIKSNVYSARMKMLTRIEHYKINSFYYK